MERRVGMLRKHRWMLAGAMGGGVLWPLDPSLAEEIPGTSPPTPPSQQELDPDLSILRRYLRRLGCTPQGEMEREPEDDAQVLLMQKVPVAVGEALDRLAERDPKRAHAWQAVRAFLDGTAAADQERRREFMFSRQMLTLEQRTLRNLAQWELRARALMDLAREGQLAADVYQEARRSLEEALRKGLAEPPAEGGAKPAPRTVDEASRVLLELLEPDLRDPKMLPSPLREEVGRLVGQLGDPEWKTREAASLRLLAIGEPALGALREALGSRDKEVEARARDLWERILAGEAPEAAAPPAKP
jgi:hypothetical protein